MTLHPTKVPTTVLFTCVLAALCLPAVASSVVVTTYDNDGGALSASGNGADTVNPAEDPTSNKSHWTNVMSRTRPASNPPEYITAWLRFDLSQVVNLGNITSARLQLYDFRPGHGESIDNTTWHVAGVHNETFDLTAENLMTWNNQASGYNEISGWDNLSNVTDWGTFTIDTGYNPWSQEIADMSSDLITLIQGDTNGLVTLGLYNLDDTAHRIGSKEAAQVSFDDETPLPLGSVAPRLILEGPDIGFPDITPRLHAGQLGAYGVLPKKPEYDFLDLSFGQAHYSNPGREHIPGKTNIALIYPFDQPRDPLPPIDTALERIDAIMAQQDVDELYGVSLGEERGYWAEYDYLSQLYDYVKLNWPELKVFQWLSTPLTPPATLRADGFIYDYYTTDVTDWQNKMQAHLDTGKELIPVLWASPPLFGLGSPTEVWLNAARQKAAWAREHDLPVMIFAVSEPGPSFTSWFSDPLAEPWRDWVMNELSFTPGDLNGDGFVGGGDLDIVRSFWGQSVTPGNLLHGDPSGDGFVGGDDLDEVRAHWGEGTPPNAVPEPSTLILCLLAIGWRRRTIQPD